MKEYAEEDTLSPPPTPPPPFFHPPKESKTQKGESFIKIWILN